VEALPPVSTFPVSMVEAAVALLPSAGFYEFTRRPETNT